MGRKKLVEEISIGDSILYRGTRWEFIQEGCTPSFGKAKHKFMVTVMKFVHGSDSMWYPRNQFDDDVRSGLIEIIPWGSE